MLRKFLCLMIGGLLLSFAATPAAFARTKEEKRAELTEKVKAGIVKLGVGEQSRIQVKLHNKTKFKGFVSEIGEEDFAVTDLKSGVTTRVAYPDVASARGNNLSTGAKIAIGMAIGAGVAILTLFILAATLGD